MTTGTRKPRRLATRLRRGFSLLVAAALVLMPQAAGAQELTGALIGTVKDAQGGVLLGAVVRVSSPSLIGGPMTRTTNDKGDSVSRRYLPDPTCSTSNSPVSPPITRTFDWREAHRRENGHPESGGRRRIGCRPGGGLAHRSTRTPGLRPASASRISKESRRAGSACSISSGPPPGSRPRLRRAAPHHGIRVRLGHQREPVPHRRTNFTCPCNGVARSEPGIGFIQEVHIQSVGASAEYGNVQGAVINVVTRQGGERFLFDAGVLRADRRVDESTGPTRGRDEEGKRLCARQVRDLTTNLGGPAVRERLWFFGGYQYLRDYDSQPGTDPPIPRTFEQDKVFGKLTWG